MSGNRALVSAVGDGYFIGSAYVFSHDANGWSETAKLTASSSSRCFGESVFIDGTTAIVGARQDCDKAQYAGAVFIFADEGSGWEQKQKLTAYDGGPGDQLGMWSWIDGDLALGAAPYEDEEEASDAGAVYVFRHTTTWSQEQKLTVSDGAADDKLGYQGCTADGNTIVLGSPYDDDNGTDSGSVYVFEHDGNSFQQRHKLTPSDAATDDLFGLYVALDGERFLTSASHNDYNGDESGAAYIFRRTTGGRLAKTWTLDPRGNWVSTTTNGVTQTRTHNAVNEITDISGDWADPAYDAAGNMVSGPRGDEPAKRLHLVYDAWNRLSKVYDDDGITAGTHDANDTLRATYRYDGLHRRVRRIVVGSDGNSTPHDIYYGAGPAMSAAAGGVEWQRLEVRRFGDTVAYEQYLWDVRYVDAPICRWHDADNDGTFEPDANEMHYYTNGANFNITALLDANSGDVVERYLYDPYGRRTVLNGQTDADPNVTEWHPDGDNRSDANNPLGHQGLPHDPETGFLDNRLRPRTPALGRWSVRDYWAGYADGMGLYESLLSCPATCTDWLGTETEPSGTPSSGDPGEMSAIQKFFMDAQLIWQAGQRGATTAADRWYNPRTPDAIGQERTTKDVMPCKGVGTTHTFKEPPPASIKTYTTGQEWTWDAARKLARLDAVEHEVDVVRYKGVITKATRGRQVTVKVHGKKEKCCFCFYTVLVGEKMYHFKSTTKIRHWINSPQFNEAKMKQWSEGGRSKWEQQWMRNYYKQVRKVSAVQRDLSVTHGVYLDPVDSWDDTYPYDIKHSDLAERISLQKRRWPLESRQQYETFQKKLAEARHRERVRCGVK